MSLYIFDYKKTADPVYIHAAAVPACPALVPTLFVGVHVRAVQSQTQEELDALLRSVLDRVFKGELG